MLKSGTVLFNRLSFTGIWAPEAQCGARLGPISWSAGRHTPVTRDNGKRALPSRLVAPTHKLYIVSD
ncbi:hypothetical protein B5X24_HaOG209825 [Helicoverpa armigera]|nr:hypothetical protein B5X24_HaOG209825 [Helicoverpa armigera]